LRQRLAHARLRQRHLRAQRVDLLVVRARGLAHLRQQQLLQRGKVGPAGLALPGQLVAQLALDALQRLAHLAARGVRGGVSAQPPGQRGQRAQPQQGQQPQDRKQQLGHGHAKRPLSGSGRAPRD
jgi:hypothetical protein